MSTQPERDEGNSSPPLAGITVVDFTEYIAGPYASMMLADMGANVIKVEPINGDHWRRQAPVAPNESRGFLGVNRGKRSIAVDIRTPPGLAIAHKLSSIADVVMVNYRPGMAKRIGLDYESIRERAPGVVYAAITAFGTVGPYRDQTGFDLLSQAAAGILAYENRLENGVPTGVRTVAPADLTTGLFTALAIVTALFRRVVTGRGEEIATNLFASGIGIQYRPLVSIENLDASNREAFLAAADNAREDGKTFEDISKMKSEILGRTSFTNYYRAFETADGLVAVACLNNRLRRNLRDLLQVDDPTVDPVVFDSTMMPPGHHDQVRKDMERKFKEEATTVWLDRLREADVPFSRVLMTEELYDDPHVVMNNLIPTYLHKALGPVRLARLPIELRDAHLEIVPAPPPLGADTEDVLRELGKSQRQIDDLEAAGVIARWRRPAEHEG